MCCLLVEVGEGHFVYCDVVLLVDFRHLGMIDLDFPKDLLFVCVDLQLVICFFLMIDLEYVLLVDVFLFPDSTLRPTSFC